MIGSIGLLGWFIDLPILTNILPNLATMKFNTALAFVLSGAALWQCHAKCTISEQPSLVNTTTLLATVVVLLSLVTLSEDLFGWNAGIDELFIQDARPDIDRAPPGRMSPATTINFILCGVALGLLGTGAAPVVFCQLCALSSIVMCLFAIAGYLYDFEQLYNIHLYSSMAVHTVTAFLLLSFGILFVHPRQGMMRIFTGRNPGSVLARRLWLPMVIIALLVGAMTEQIEQHQLIGNRIDSAFLVVFIVVLSSLLIVLVGQRLNRADEQLHNINRLYAVLSQCNQSIVHIKERDRLFDEVCRIAVDTGGFRLAWLGLTETGTDIVKPVAHAGTSADYLSRVHITTRDEPAGHGPTGTAIREDRPVICNDIGKNPLFVQWNETVQLYGNTSIASFPIKNEERTIGALCVHSAEKNYFSTEEIRLLTEVAGDISFAVRQMDSEVKRLQAEQQVAQALKETNEFKTALDEHAIVAITNRLGDITYVNDKFCTISGYSREELMGQNHRIINSGYHPIEFFHDLWRTIAMGKVWHCEICNRAKDGSLYWVDTTIVPFLDDQGKPRQYIAIRSDITERKNAEAVLQKHTQELQRSNAELEQFAYVASHDLQEPLRSVAGCVQLLQKRYQGQLDGRADELIFHTVEGVVRMQQLIDDLLKFSRAGTRGLQRKIIDSKHCLQMAVDNLQVAIEQSEAQVSYSELPEIYADRTQMTQLFQNLISNAIKFRGQLPAQIDVSYRCSENEHIFSVRDNGIGIEPQYFERIFGIFQRLHTRNEYPGTGVGLALCSKIVQAHGGRIWVESEPGKGAVFFFTLPLQDHTSADEL